MLLLKGLLPFTLKAIIDAHMPLTVYALSTPAKCTVTCVRLHPRKDFLHVVDVLADDLHVLQAILGALCPTEGQYGCATREPPDMHLQPWQT